MRMYQKLELINRILARELIFKRHDLGGNGKQSCPQLMQFRYDWSQAIALR